MSNKKKKNRHPKKKGARPPAAAVAPKKDAQAEREFVEGYRGLCKEHGYELSPRPIPRANLDRNGNPDGSFTTVWNMLIVGASKDVRVSEEEEEALQKAYLLAFKEHCERGGYQLVPMPKHVPNYARNGAPDGTYSLMAEIVVTGDGVRAEVEGEYDNHEE